MGGRIIFGRLVLGIIPTTLFSSLTSVDVLELPASP